MNKTPSIVKKILKAILWVASGFVLLFVLIAVLIRIPAVQNRIVYFATSFVSNKTHTAIEINKILISFPKSVVIEGLFVEDLQKDTLLFAGRIKVNITFKNLLSDKIHVNNLILENANLNLSRVPADSLFNFSFLLTSFSDTGKQKKVKTESASKWTFRLDNLSLKNIRFLLDDQYGGINVAASLENLDLKMDEIDLESFIFRIDEILIENATAEVLMNKQANTNKKNANAVLPVIASNKIQINNSTFSYVNSISKQSIGAVLNKFKLRYGTVDLQKEKISVNSFNLANSAIQYHTADTGISSDTAISEPAKTKRSNWNIAVKTLGLDDISLAYQVRNRPVRKNVFDANHQQYNHVSLEAKDLYYSSDKSGVSIEKFTAIDKNNFTVTKFETDFSMDQQSITANKLIAITGQSSIVADLNIEYPSLRSLRDSISGLLMNLNMKQVSIRNSDILYFVPQLRNQAFFKNKLNLTSISGMVKGKVNNLKGNNMVINTGVRTLVKADFSITGLPDVKTAFFTVPDLTLKTCSQDIKMMAGSFIPNSIVIPEDITIQSAFEGGIKSFETQMEMNSSMGDAEVYASLDKNENFRSKVSIVNFNLGSLLNDTALFGPVTLTAEAIGHGLDKNTINAKIVAEAPQFYLNNYQYHNLSIDGRINGREFEGNINLDDENAVFDFDGLVNVNPNQELYSFRLNLEGADLQKLNFTREDIRISFIAEADVKGGEVNSINGNAGISNLVLVKGEKRFILDSLLFASVNTPLKSDFNFSSALIDLNYSGNIGPAGLSVELKNFLSHYFPFSEGIPVKTQIEPANFTLLIQLHNHPILSQVLLPRLKEFEPGIIQASFDSEKNDLKLKVSMKNIVYGTTEIHDFVLDVNSGPSALNYKVSSRSISSSQIKLENFLLDGTIADQKILANLSSVGDNKNKNFIIHSVITREQANYKLAVDPKDFYLVNSPWDIAADNFIELGKEGFLIHHFFINNTVSHINIASVHDQFNDDLNIEIRNFKLDEVSRIIEKDTGLVKGTIDGNVLLKRVNDNYGIIADIKISGLLIRDIPVGNLTVKADNPTAGKFDIDLNLSGPDNNLAAKGYYVPGGGDNSVNIITEVQSLSMKTFEAFSMGQLSETSGTLSGNLLILGASDAPEITGELVFNDVFVKPAFLNNRLEIKDETIQIKKEGVYFNSFTLTDPDRHNAIIDGSVQMTQFKDFIFDLSLRTKDFLLFNTTFRDNDNFYGRMVFDSKIDIKGPITLPVLNGTLLMKKGSNFTFAVPEDKLTTDKGEDVIEFVDSVRLNSILYRTDKKIAQKSRFSGFDISAIIEIDREATLRLLMDPSSSDSLVVRGEAALSFAMDRSGKMSLTGAYNLDEGSYIVSLESVIKRKFDIIPGSTIIWSGDPLDAEISINAKYTVRASPFDLVAVHMPGLTEVEKDGYMQRYPFWVNLKLRGEILHPVISFGIQLPPEDKGILGGTVNQKLNMLNEDESALNKQVFALLVLGRFVQENPLQTESGGASTIVRTTVSNFLSSQLNRLSSNLVPGTELNFNVQSYNEFQTGEAKGRTQVEVGMKKQLFNERLSVQVGGTVDVEGEKAKQNSASEITGDVTVEYKLTEDGRYRMKAFRVNQYAGAIEGQLVETGAGFVYVRDFNEWKDILKAPKKKNDALIMEQNNDTINNK